MARTIDIHDVMGVRYAPIDELVGVAQIRGFLPADDGGGQPTPVPLNGLAFTSPDGKTDIYVLTDEQKQIVVQTLTSGIVLP